MPATAVRAGRSPDGGGTLNPCAFFAKVCGGQQAGGGRRFILHGDDPPEAEVDAGASARKERRPRLLTRSAIPAPARVAV